MTRYRLKIPEMIRREDAKIAHILLGPSRREPITEKWAYSTKRFCDIPSDWLEEIKDEPRSAEKSWEAYLIKRNFKADKRPFIDGFEVGAAENEKKHRGAIKIIRDWFRNGCADDWKKLDEYLKNLPEEN